MDYKKYRLSAREIMKYTGQYLLLFLLIGKLFYDSFPAGLLFCASFPILLRKKAAELAKERRQRLLGQFKDLILSFSSALKAGYSIENAFREAYRDLQFIYEKGEDILVECKSICLQMDNNVVLEKLLVDFGQRTGLTDIRDFAAIFAIAKHSGGNLNQMIQSSAQTISDKIEVKAEIQLLFASKKMEQRIMNTIPIAIMLYISISSPGYFDALYGNMTGIVIMTICLVIYAFAYFLSKKIMAIEV